MPTAALSLLDICILQTNSTDNSTLFVFLSSLSQAGQADFQLQALFQLLFAALPILLLPFIFQIPIVNPDANPSILPLWLSN